MLKIFPVLILAVSLWGCTEAVGGLADTNPITGTMKAGVTTVGNVADETTVVASDAVNQLFTLSTGFLYAIAAVEINTNASSLIIDKTKEKVADYNANTVKTLEPGRFLFVVPPRITASDGSYTFDENMHKLIRNYMAVGKYAIPVDDIKQADYIAVITIKESFVKRYGTNYSVVNFSIMDKFDLPVFASSVRIESSSDKNFWYYSQKDARPVKSLTMKGLSYIMTKALPEAHGDKKTLAAEAKKYALAAKEKLTQGN